MADCTCNSINTCKVHMIQGERGPKGDKGDKGDRGPQGERGFRGERGFSGEGINIHGVLEQETQLPTVNNIRGDAYVIMKPGTEVGYLYVYSDTDIRSGWVNVG